MNKIILFAALYSIPVLSHGWSESWTTDTNEFHITTAREYMELVWAVDELSSATKITSLPFFTRSTYIEFGPIFHDYLIVETNYIDMVPYITTSAAYKAEMWEPSPRQISKLIERAYREILYWTEINTNTTLIQWESYATPASIDDNVPWWVYTYAAEIKTHVDYGDENFYACPPAGFISSNPVVSYGGRMADVGGRPYPLLEYPIHEYPFGATITQQVFKTFSCETDYENPGEFTLLPPEIERGGYSDAWEGLKLPWNYRLDLGIHDVSNLVISWDSTLHPYVTNELGFTLVYADKTNAIGPYFALDEDFYQPLLPNAVYNPLGYWHILDLYATNSIEISGVLPITKTCENIIPIDLILESGNQYTHRVPGITAMINGIVPSGRHQPSFIVPPNSTNSAPSSPVRRDLIGWTDSWTVLKRIHHLIAELPKRSHVRPALFMVNKSFYSTNVVLTNYSGGITCDDVELLPYFGPNTTNYDYSLNTSMDVWAYDDGWISDVVVYGSPAGENFRRPWDSFAISGGSLSGSVSSFGLGKKEMTGSCSAYMFTFAIELDNYFVENRPLYYPTIGSVDIYLTTNYWDTTHGFREFPSIRGGLNYYTNYVFDEYPQFARSLVTYLTMTGINRPIINANSAEALQDLFFEVAAKAHDNCSGGTNKSSKNGAVEYHIRPVMIANWNFTTNFDAYWDMYPAPE